MVGSRKGQRRLDEFFALMHRKSRPDQEEVMAVEKTTPPYLWTVIEAWQWLIQVPGMGFVALLFLGFQALSILAAITVLFLA